MRLSLQVYTHTHSQHTQHTQHTYYWLLFLFLKEQIKASSIEEEEEEDLILPLEHYCRDCGHGGRHRGRRAAPHTSSQSGDVFLYFYVIDTDSTVALGAAGVLLMISQVDDPASVCTLLCRSHAGISWIALEGSSRRSTGALTLPAC